jgi:hypothetical protein
LRHPDETCIRFGVAQEKSGKRKHRRNYYYSGPILPVSFTLVTGWLMLIRNVMDFHETKDNNGLLHTAVALHMAKGGLRRNSMPCVWSVQYTIYNVYGRSVCIQCRCSLDYGCRGYDSLACGDHGGQTRQEKRCHNEMFRRIFPPCTSDTGGYNVSCHGSNGLPLTQAFI